MWDNCKRTVLRPRGDKRSNYPREARQVRNRQVVPSYPRIAQRTSDPNATGTGAGDIVIDDNGKRYRVMDYPPPDATGDRCYQLYPDGTIR